MPGPWPPYPSLALCAALLLAVQAAPASPSTPGDATPRPPQPPQPPQPPAPERPSTWGPLLRRWRLDNALDALDALEALHTLPPGREESDEELDTAQRYPPRRALQWLPSGLGTHWDLRGENSHPVRHAKHHRSHHGPAATATATSLEPAPPASASAASPASAAVNATLEPPESAPRVDSFVPLALSSASRGAVADVVVMESEAGGKAEAIPTPREEADSSVRIRPSVDVACYSSNQVLIIIAMTCMLSLGFIALVMGCVHCCTTTRSKEAQCLQDDASFSPVDCCDVRGCVAACPRTCPRVCSCPSSCPRRQLSTRDPQWSVLRKLIAAMSHQRQLHRQEDVENSDDSEEELLFHAPSGPVASGPSGPSGSASMISLHSLHSLRERQASVSMEDLLLIGRCR